MSVIFTMVTSLTIKVGLNLLPTCLVHYKFVPTQGHKCDIAVVILVTRMKSHL